MDTWLPLKDECPECRAPVEAEALQRDRLAERLVSNLETRCQFATAGCAWVGKRGEMNAHLAHDCQRVTCVCPNEGCGAEMPRGELASHAETCVAQPTVPCPFGCRCVVAGSLIEEHKSTCVMAPSMLMAAIRELTRQNQELAFENERLRAAGRYEARERKVARRKRAAPDVVCNDNENNDEQSS